MRKKNFLAALAILAAIVVVACGGAEKAPTETAKAPAAAPASGTASIAGTIAYANGDPDTAISMNADPKCATLHKEPVLTEKIVTGETGGLANVFVYVKAGLPAGKYPVPETTHLLDQKGCQYRPHVSGIRTGQKLIIRNSDPTLHNVHALPKVNQEFNQGQPFENMELERTFDKAEVMVRFKCDVHPWMSSYMGVVDHPFFAVSDAAGSFKIDGLPAGEYTLEAWHEELGTTTQKVSVTEGQAASVAFSFAAGGVPSS